MTRWDCRRCDWKPTEADGSSREQLVDHSTEVRHPLCVLCGLSLPVEDARTCLPCVADVRRRLAAIEATYALLGVFLVRVPSPSDWRRSGPRGGGPGLPGGDALVMRAGGSDGRSQDRGVRWADGLDFSHEQDESSDDAPTVAHDLSKWEDDWRSWRGEGAAAYPADVSSAVGYLTARLGWAAQAHDAFDEFAADVRRILRRLETATATDDREDVGAACLSCGTDLRRAYGGHRRCHHERPTQGLLLLGWTEPEPPTKPVPIYETVLERDARLRVWDEKHAHCDQGGQERTWRCPRCRRRFDHTEYGLAVASSMRAKRVDANYWVPVAVAARLVDRTQAVVKRWAEDEDAPVLLACDVRTRRLRVLLSSVFRASDARGRRRHVA